MRDSRRDWCRIRVLGGLPAIAEYSAVPNSFDPSTGRPGTDIEDIAIQDRRGRTAHWIVQRLTQVDWDDIHEQIRFGGTDY
jgi:hypothetical protein